MFDHTSDLPDFPEPGDEPLPPRVSRDNADGWTGPRIRVFIDYLSQTGNVARACRDLDISRQAAYALRRRSVAFALAWDGAILRHRDALVDICMDRALNGAWEEVAVGNGKVERLRHDGATLRFMMARADRLADSRELHDRPARMAEGYLEDLVDMFDPAPLGREAVGDSPDGAGGEPDPLDRNRLDPAAAAEFVQWISDSALPDWDDRVVKRYEARREQERKAERRNALARSEYEAADQAAADARRDAERDPEAAAAAARKLAIVPDPGNPEREAHLLSEEERERLALLRWLRALHALPPHAVDTSDLDPADRANWSSRDWERAAHGGLLERADFCGEEDDGEGPEDGPKEAESDNHV